MDKVTMFLSLVFSILGCLVCSVFFGFALGLLLCYWIEIAEGDLRTKLCLAMTQASLWLSFTLVFFCLFNDIPLFTIPFIMSGFSHIIVT